MRKMIMSAPLVLLLAIPQQLGCTEGSEPTGELPIYFSALSRERFEPQVMRDPGPRVSAEELAKLQPVFENVEANAPELFKRPEFARSLASVEEAYWISGKTFELLKIYQEDIDRQGLKSPAAVRLAWGYVRLGQERAGLKLIEDLLRLHPENADVWVLLGAHWVKQAAESREAALRVIASWRQAVELDPLYVGFEGIDAPALQREVARLMDLNAPTAEELDAVLAAYAPAPEEPTPPDEEEPPPPPAKQPTSVSPSDEPGTVGPAVGAPATEARAPVARAPESLAVMMAQARLALSGGDTSRASSELAQALRQHVPEASVARAPEVMKDEAQLFELVRLAWAVNLDRAGAARAFRVMAARPTARSEDLYQRAMFAWRELEDIKLALSLIEQLEKEDAALARKLNTTDLKRRIRE